MKNDFSSLIFLPFESGILSVRGKKIERESRTGRDILSKSQFRKRRAPPANQRIAITFFPLQKHAPPVSAISLPFKNFALRDLALPMARFLWSTAEAQRSPKFVDLGRPKFCSFAHLSAFFISFPFKNFTLRDPAMPIVRFLWSRVRRSALPKIRRSGAIQTRQNKK